MKRRRFPYLARGALIGYLVLLLVLLRPPPVMSPDHPLETDETDRTVRTNGRQDTNPSLFFNGLFNVFGKLRGTERKRRKRFAKEDEKPVFFEDDEEDEEEEGKVAVDSTTPVSPIVVDSCVCLSCRAPWTPEETENGVHVSFRGEFGYELLAALPFAYFHFLNGSLKSTVSCGHPSMAIFYWFSPNHSHDDTCRRGSFLNFVEEYGWTNGLHASEIPLTWHPPPLGPHFMEWGKVWRDVRRDDKLVVISNKFEAEWGYLPVNSIDVKRLKRIVKSFLQNGFYVVYNRPGESLPMDSWQQLFPNESRFDDYKTIRRIRRDGGSSDARRLRLMQEIAASVPEVSFNEVQMRMMARSRCFVSVQGGNSIIASYFEGTNVVFGRTGNEFIYKSYKRIYSRISGTRLKVARTYRQLIEKVDEMIKESFCGAI